jgi:hypothetical protein
MTAEPAYSTGINVDTGVIDDARRRQRRHRFAAILLIVLTAVAVLAVAQGGGPPARPASATILTPGSSSRFPPSIYPPSVHSRGGALAACPSPAGAERFTAAARTAAITIASRYDRVGEATDVRNADRAWWPNVRHMWRSGGPGRGVSYQVVSGARIGPELAYSTVIAYSCGRRLASDSLSVYLGPRQRHGCDACVSSLFFIDRRGHPLIYYLY